MHSYEIEGRGRVAVALAVASILMIWFFHLVLDSIDFQPEWVVERTLIRRVLFGPALAIRPLCVEAQFAQETQAHPTPRPQWGVDW